MSKKDPMKRYKVHINGKSYEVAIEELGEATAESPRSPKPAAPARPTQQPTPATPAPKPAAKEVRDEVGSISAPMPGTILRVAVAGGDSVKKGDTLLILEAMKMENEILAPHDGTIAEVKVAQGASVNAGDLLVVMGS